MTEIELDAEDRKFAAGVMALIERLDPPRRLILARRAVLSVPVEQRQALLVPVNTETVNRKAGPRVPLDEAKVSEGWRKRRKQADH
jgi:hypothetical protein